jgi:hypothetical protein
LPVANGGTGAATFTANNVLLGNGTSAFQVVAPGTSGNVLTSNGTTWTSAAAPNTSTITIDNKTGAYTVVAGDLGKVINCTANSFTVSLTAAATLGAGFSVTIRNTSSTSSHVITIDPAGSETIDGRTTITLRRGEGTQIVCDGTNWQTGDKKTMRGYSDNIDTGQSRANATGNLSVSIGAASVAAGATSYAFGFDAQTSGDNGTSIGSNSGSNGSRIPVGAGGGAMALGGSYASGSNSFAAAVANNTSTYGATGSSSIAIGQLAKSTATRSVAIGGETTLASGQQAVAIGGSVLTASGLNSIAIGGSDSTASGDSSYAFGVRAVSAEIGKYSYGAFTNSTQGASQSGMIVLRGQTTNATPAALVSNTNAAGTANQLILRNDSTFAFRILVVARRTDADNESAGYEFVGVVDRNANAASTALVGAVTKTVLAEDTAAWDVNVTADTTNGGLKVEVTGEAAKTILWVATCWTSEVTG